MTLYTTDLKAKTCKDCAHMTEVSSYLGCKKVMDVVLGQAPPARNVRADETLCGPDGKWFQEQSWREDRV